MATWSRFHFTTLVLLLLAFVSLLLVVEEINKLDPYGRRLRKAPAASQPLATADAEDVVDRKQPPKYPFNLCPAYPPHLKKRLKININITLAEAEKRLEASVLPGGFSYPKDCIARWRVAVIVPFRNRESQVGPFLNHLYPFLKRQQLNASVYIVNQTDSLPFNRARLLNVGFVEALGDGPFDCFIFHDVDLLPEDDRHLYHCSAMPRHLNVAASNNAYKPLHRMPYSLYFGGACALTERHLRMVNGWSNRYWGWGAEDDDMRRRIALRKLHVWRYPKEVAKYTMLPHEPSLVNPNRYEDLRKNIRHFKEDGLNSLEYDLVGLERRPLFTSIKVDFTRFHPSSK